ncbi:MAG: J domain-containing protein [Fluviicola sp.]|nr:J domain-containing protein [Fluviicola sp.]
MKNYYDILGVKKNATSREIRKQCMLLASQLHPEKQHSNLLDSPKQFVNIVEAYEVLYDDKCRRVYDKLLNFEKKDGLINEVQEEKYRTYISAVASRGVNKGEFYSKKKFKNFKEDYKLIAWYDITAIIQNLIP